MKKTSTVTSSPFYFFEKLVRMTTLFLFVHHTKQRGYKSSGTSSIQICISTSPFAILARAWATKFPLRFI